VSANGAVSNPSFMWPSRGSRPAYYADCAGRFNRVAAGNAQTLSDERHRIVAEQGVESAVTAVRKQHDFPRRATPATT
jgi:hypothetical protein